MISKETECASAKDPNEKLMRAEQMAICRHRERLCKLLNREVAENEAATDWHTHHALKWRQERLERMMALQRDEIMRHKWLESEKQNGDVGAKAVFDWIERYAESWRKWYDDNFD